MPQQRRADQPIYTFRVRILGGYFAPPVSKSIWRDIEIAADQTLADLSEAIPLAFDFDDPHLWAFFLSGKPWDRATEYAPRIEPDPFGGPEATDATRTQIRDVPFLGSTGKKEFLFLFDFGDEWHFGVKLRHIREGGEPGTDYPCLAGEHGTAPPQYPDIEDEDD